MTDRSPYQLFPDLADDEYQALKQDIAEHGVMVPVEYDDNGEILDGHHRVRAWTELAYEGVDLATYPRIVREGLTEKEKRSHVRRLNILRRHLNQEQRRELIADQVRETPERSNRQIAGTLGVSDHTVGSVRSELEASAQIAQIDEREVQRGDQTYTQSTANIGRPAATAYTSDEPNEAGGLCFECRQPIPLDAEECPGCSTVAAPDDEPAPLTLPSTQAIRDAHLRADFLKCLQAASQMAAYAPERIAAVLPVDDAEGAERTLGRLSEWTEGFRIARAHGLRVIGG